MNLFFRLCLMMAQSLFRRRSTVPVMSVTQRSFSVWITDQDVLGHMTNSRYFSFTDLAMIDFMLKTGALSVARRNKWLPIVCFEDLAFHRMLKFPQRFELTTRICGWTEDYIVFQHAFVRSGQIHCDGISLARFVHRRGGSVQISDVAEAFGIVEDSPALPEPAQHAVERLTRARRTRKTAEARELI